MSRYYNMTGVLCEIVSKCQFRISFDTPDSSKSASPMLISLTLRGYFDPNLKVGDHVRIFSEKSAGTGALEHVLLVPYDFPDIFADEGIDLQDFLRVSTNEQAMIVARNLGRKTGGSAPSVGGGRLKFNASIHARNFYKMTRESFTEEQQAAIEEWLHYFGEDNNHIKFEMLVSLLPDRPSRPVDVAAVKARLDHDIWGMEAVKHHLLTHLAASNASEEKGTVICLVGPPGVGKTAIARALAEALDKPHVFQSCAGWCSSIEPLGCNSTYNNATIGKLVGGFSRCGGRTDVMFTLDELDKIPPVNMMGKDGSAFYSLLEVFSEKQVTDAFLGVPVSTRNTIWVVTCNDLANIPDVLVDRFDYIIEVPSYSEKELAEICKACIIPRLNEKYQSKLTFTEEAIFEVARAADDAGARGTSQNMEKIFKEMLTLQITDGKVDGAVVRRILGLRKQPAEAHNFVTHPGTAMMLGVSSLGKGTAIPVETRILPGNGLIVTGAPEGSQEVIDTVRTAMTALEMDYGFDFSDKKLHVHFGCAGNKKKGSSAGLPIILSLYSAMTRQAMPEAASATGEIDIFNHVFAVGRIREKIEGARRAGASKIYVPAANFAAMSEKEQAELLNNPAFKVVGVSSTFEMIRDLYGGNSI